ncbi:MAG TPA: hypothetical protein PLL26_06755, partial [Candidatus Dojkabacteria bacterium]|nr:hypothetical protein [Candidatus Dojkabacteria bacterium]
MRLDPQKYEDPKFVQQKNKIEWNMYKIRQAYENSYMILIRIIITFGLIVIVAKFNIWVLLLIVVSQIPNIFTNIYFGKRFWSIWDTNGEEKILYQAYKGNLHTDDLEQFQELKVLGYGEYIKNKALTINKKFVDRTIKLEKRRSSWAILGVILEYACLSVSYYILFSALLNASIPVGTLFFLYYTMGSVKSNLNTIFYKLTTIQSNKNISEAFYNFYEEKELLNNGSIKINTKDPFSIQFENVWFAYPKT